MIENIDKKEVNNLTLLIGIIGETYHNLLETAQGECFLEVDRYKEPKDRFLRDTKQFIDRVTKLSP